MARRHQRHATRAGRDRAIWYINTFGVWSATGLPRYDDASVDITVTYTGSGTGTLNLITVPRADPSGGYVTALSVPFSGPGTYVVAGGLSSAVYVAGLQDSLGTLSIGLI